MSLKSLVLNAADHLDGLVPKVDFRLGGKAKHLVILLVHSLFRSDVELKNSGVFPHERMTVDKFVSLIRKLKGFGYEFIHADQLNDPATLPDRAALLTFDDTYKSISHAVQPMEDFQVPGMVFVVPWNALQRECFWWDVYYRRLIAEGWDDRAIYALIDEKKMCSFERVRAEIIDRWGEGALGFETDLDRPCGLNELRELASNPLFSFGNHTYHHTALPFQNGMTITSEIRRGYQFLQETLGQSSSFLAFPNGDYSDEAVSRAFDEGARYCLSIEPRGCVIREGDASRCPRVLGRFMVSGERSIERQVHGMTRMVSIASSIKCFKKHKYP